MRQSIRYLILSFFITLPLATYAGSIETYTFTNIEHEALYKELVKEFRCPKCQNQDISASNAPLSKDLRRKTYDMVIAGKSRNEIIDFMVQRYGDFVLYRPPFKLKTVLLWLGPPLFLLFSLFFLVNFLRNRTATAEIELDDKQRESMRDLLK